MAMNGGIEPPEGATERSLSPSQMTYDQLLQLGENVGKVSKGTDQKQLDDLPTCTYGEAKSKGETFAILGEQCAVCRCEYDDDDIVRILPCRHAEHAECLDQWLLRNRSCPSASATSARARARLPRKRRRRLNRRRTSRRRTRRHRRPPRHLAASAILPLNSRSAASILFTHSVAAMASSPRESQQAPRRPASARRAAPRRTAVGRDPAARRSSRRRPS